MRKKPLTDTEHAERLIEAAFIVRELKAARSPDAFRKLLESKRAYQGVLEGRPIEVFNDRQIREFRLGLLRRAVIALREMRR